MKDASPVRDRAIRTKLFRVTKRHGPERPIGFDLIKALFPATPPKRRHKSELECMY